MAGVPSTVDAVRTYLQKRIDRLNARIAHARRAAASQPRRGARRRGPLTAPEVAMRRAYRDALRALNAIPSDRGGPAALRLAAEEVERVKSALAKIYEVTQHANHDIADVADWTFVEGEAKAGLNVVHEVEKNR